MKNENFNQKSFLDKLGLDISQDNYEESIQRLQQLCIYNPFQAQQFIQIYLNAWCFKIQSMLNNKSFNVAGSRIRSLYMLVIYNKVFNRLITIYFDKIKQEKFFQTLENYHRTIHLSMESQYFYQKGQYDEAEKSVIKCFEGIKKNFNNKSHLNDSWLLIRKCLKNINDKEKAEVLLKEILHNIVNN